MSSLIGLVVILGGLVLYRYSSASASEAAAEDTDKVHVFAPGSFLPVLVRRKPPAVARTAMQIRSGLYSKIGVIGSPSTPHRSPVAHALPPRRASPLPPPRAAAGQLASSAVSSGRLAGTGSRSQQQQQHRTSRDDSNIQ
jgi:hypothetical protein